jgi:ferredoxin
VADREDRLALNVAGRFYVDFQCIDCDLCRQTAPANFRRSDSEGYSFVFRQPETTEEAELCAEALDECPVEAIGDDG